MKRRPEEEEEEEGFDLSKFVGRSLFLPRRNPVICVPMKRMKSDFLGR